MMNDTSRDLTKLTEFPRLEFEENQSGVSVFINKLFKFPKFYNSETDLGHNPPSEARACVAGEVETEQNLVPNEESPQSSNDYNIDITNEGRSLANVLKRISSLVALGTSSGTRYEDTELAQYWMPDHVSKECYECGTRFSTLRRRHHCRVCGQIFCSRCCSQRVPGQICGCSGGLRVCTYCSKVVLSYLQNRDIGEEISADLRTLQENLQVKFPDAAGYASTYSTQDKFMFDTHNAPDPQIVSPKEELQNIFGQICDSLPTQQQRYRLARHNSVWRGSDIMQWITENTNSNTRAQASSVCQSLLQDGFLQCVTDQDSFADYALYRPNNLPEHRPDLLDRNLNSSETLTESVSSFCLDLNLDESSARIVRTPNHGNKEISSSSEEDPLLLETSENHGECLEAGEQEVCSAVSDSGQEHLSTLMSQCLSREGLALSWLHVLLPLCQHAADNISPDLYSKQMDVRLYVQIKKVPGGAPQDSRVVSGVVLTKNVAHRGMPQQLLSPSVLLLDSHIVYQRVEGKLTSLEPVMLQEQEYLTRCAARVLALRPRLVLARGAVARAVQDKLRAAGVALAVGVGPRALRRAARCTDAEIIAQVDARIAQPKLGRCKSFHVHNYETKTLMILEGCAKSQLGCCILLRGAPSSELIKVKRVVRFMLLAAYNWKLEYSFLTDIGARLPDVNIYFGEGSKENSPDTFEDENESNMENKNSIKCEIVNTESSLNNIEDWNDSKHLTDTKTDPLQSSPHLKKTDSDKTLKCSVPISDNSDPLRAKQLSLEDDVFLQEAGIPQPLKSDYHRVGWSTEGTILSMSPHVKTTLPYLETESGRRCALRKYFCTPLFSPPNTNPLTPRATRRHLSRKEERPVTVFKNPHPLVSNALTSSAEDTTTRALLAHYRATGCRLSNNIHRADCPQYIRAPSSDLAESPSSAPSPPFAAMQDPPDPLAPENHQRLTLLFYSNCVTSPNVPDFCLNPRMVCMEMYGTNDITIGMFLERYCFNPEFKCRVQSCQVPIIQHVRRFIHGDGCVTISCSVVGNSTNLHKTLPLGQFHDDPKQAVMWWSRCLVCSQAPPSPSVRLRPPSLQLSLAKYLELRLRAARYTHATACAHALNTQHAHYFARGVATACFKYSKIKFWDVCLPPATISTDYNTLAMRDALVDQVNHLVLKGHDVFSSQGSLEACADEQAAFKQHMECIHLHLTSSALETQHTRAGVVRQLWSVRDELVCAERVLREVSERCVSNKTQPKVTPHAHGPAPHTVEVFQEPEESPTGNTAGMDSGSGDEDSERLERRSVRAVLSQLLNNSQPHNQQGIIISDGLLPVVVYAGEIGSVVAASLASSQYQLMLQQLLSQGSDQEDIAEASTGSSVKDKADSDGKSKMTKNSNEHIEVQLKDGLICRVYYAVRFQKLRAMFLSPLTDNPNIVDDFIKPNKTEGNLTEEKDLSDNEEYRAGKVEESERDGLKCQSQESESRHAKLKGDEGGKEFSTKCAKELSDVEEGFIRSLSRCVAWTARGGKSGSTFCKTQDDRFVLKEMSKLDFQLFLDMAPHYFNYLMKCRQQNLPTLLARIVGVYRVGSSGGAGGLAGAGGGVLAMENLFYGRGGSALTRRFDLKGARRNRLAPHAHAHADNVLMDENLLNMRWDSPLYLQSHSATVLWAAVERDSAFLAKHQVIDYSLLLGLDESRNELVIGIIDYIRTFTWDKKLEHIVKKGLSAVQPTITSPAQYRQRFCDAAREYFLHSPGQWDSLQRGLHPSSQP